MLASNQAMSRSNLLQWLGSIPNVKVDKIENLGTGCVYLQLLDHVHPHAKVPLNKLVWAPKHETEILQNLKLVNIWLDKVGAGKVLEIQKLAKCKYQDNLETLQWFKRYVDSRNQKENDKRPKSHDNSAPINENRISAPNLMPQQPTIKPPKKLVKMPEKQIAPTIKVEKIDVEDSKPQTRTLASFEEVKKVRKIEALLRNEPGLDDRQKYTRIVQIVYQRNSAPASIREADHSSEEDLLKSDRSRTNIPVELLSASSNLLDPLPPTFTSFIKAFKPPQSANSNANNSLLLEQSENKSLNLLDSYGKFGNGVNEKAADLSIAKATDPNQDRAIQDVPNVESAHPHTRSYPVKDPERKDPQNYPSST